MTPTAALIVALMVAFLGTGAAFHFYWGLGGRIGHRVSVPERVDAQARGAGTPLPVATLGVGVVLTLICASLVLIVSGATLGLPRGLWRIGMACVGLVLLLRGFSWPTSDCSSACTARPSRATTRGSAVRGACWWALASCISQELASG